MICTRFAGLILAFFTQLIIILGPAQASVSSTSEPLPPRQAVAATMMGVPLHFEANHGQVDGQVKFLARGNGYTLFLAPTETVMILSGRDGSNVMRGASPGYQQSIVRMKLEGANSSPAIEGMEPLPGIVNYFIGNDPAKWHRDVPTYAKVHYREAYPGIDLAYYGNQGKVEYDFIVAPGADPNQIKLAFDGASGIKVAASGDLLLTTALGEVHLQKPLVYQLEPNGHKTLVAGQYVVGADRQEFSERRKVQIQLAAYDRRKPLVIDPVLLFSTHLGGNGADGGKGIGVDASGNMYVTGVTASVDFPTLNPFQASYGGGNLDVFVTKLNATGALVYSTYLGGSGADYGGLENSFPMNLNFGGLGIAVDSVGNAYIAGTTQSLNFPTLNAYQSVNGSAPFISDDVFVTKLGPTGGLVYSTYLGSNSSDYGFAIAVDAAQNAYVTGQAWKGFPIYNPFSIFGLEPNLGIEGSDAYTDAFITKFNSTGGLIYSRWFGGGLSESGYGIAVGSGSVYLTGVTTTNLVFASVDASQSAYGGNQDAFVAKVDDATGQWLWVTYLGGSNTDWGKGIAVDGSGNVYVTGETSSTDFPTTNASQGINAGTADAFVAKFSTSGTRLYSTYLGANNYDTGNGIVADTAGNAYVTGQTASPDFPILNASQSTYGGTTVAGSNIDRGDAFVTKFNATGGRVYSTYLGGDGADKGYGIAVDTAGNAYITGETYSSNFPLVNPSLSSPSPVNAFVAKIGEPNTNDPPVCTAAQPSVASLWKADHTMVPVSILGITDPNNDPVTITFPSVTQDEPVSGLDRRDLSPDAAVSGQQILLRAERDQKGDGRVYEVHFTATDSQNGACSGIVQVQVPLNKKNPTAVDSGQSYNSFGP